MVVFGEMAVDMDGVKRHALTLQSLEDKVVHRPKSVLREGVCAQAVLVAHHDQFKIKVLADEGQVAEHPFGETEFLKCINLLVGRFLDEGAVAVDEQDALGLVGRGGGGCCHVVIRS